MNPKSLLKATALCVTVVAIPAIVSHAGPLNPPAGPITSTNKTLAEVEPRIAINAANTPGDADSLFKITQAGSYYLTGNISGVAGKHGIEIAASGVTIDLMGFEVAGVAGSLDGIRITVSGITNVAVLNGSIRNWGGSGINFITSLAICCRIDGVLAAGNAGRGIDAGFSTTVVNCSAKSNTGAGIRTGAFCSISRCTAYANSNGGISTADACVVSGCCGNLNSGAAGIHTGIDSIVIGCTASRNATPGIDVLTSSTVADCVADANDADNIACDSRCMIRGNTCTQAAAFAGSGAGIHALAGDNRIEGNNCVSGERGIQVDAAGNIIIRNTCSGNGANWNIAANNIYGPIVDRTAPASPAVTTNSAASTLGSTDPNANFSY